MAFSPDGTWLVSGSESARNGPGQVDVWDGRTGQKLHSLAGNRIGVASLAVSPDGTRLAAASGVGASGPAEVQLWEMPSGRHLRSFEGHTGNVLGVTFSPDGQRLASTGDGVVKIWDIQTGQEVLSLKLDGWGRGIAFSPDGHFLAASANRSYPQTRQEISEIKLWDARGIQEALPLKGHVGVVTIVTFSHDGKRLASGSSDKTVRIWDADWGEELLTLWGHTGGVRYLAFSPDGRWLASTSRGPDATQPEEVKVWDVYTGQELLSRMGPTKPITSLAFGPDSRFLAAGTGIFSGGGLGEVKLWDTLDGREELVLEGYTHVALTPDGQRLIALCQGGPKKPLDLLTRQEVADPGILLRSVWQPQTRATPNTSAVSRDKQRLAQMDQNTIRLFDLSISEEERAYRQALAEPDLGWHLRQAADAERTGTWFAVAFHLRHALKLRPSDDALAVRLLQAQRALQR